MNDQPPTEWQIHGTVDVAGTERTIWCYDTAEGSSVFQITTGEQPSNDAGYHLLESLLAAKGVKIQDVEIKLDGIRP